MKLILNAFQHAPAVTGTDRMAHNFLNELQKIDSVNQFWIICSREVYVKSAIQQGNNFRILSPPKLPGGSLVQRISDKLWRETLPLWLKLFNADVYFSFHNMRLPAIRVATRQIASNLDLIPLAFEEYKNVGRLTEESQLKAISHAVKNADAFMSISEFSKNELFEKFGVKPAQVEVIYLAPDPSFTPRDAEKGSFIFTVGGNEPRKNVVTITRAFAMLPEKLQKQYPLLIAGRAWGNTSLDELKLNSNIMVLDQVEESRLRELFKNATVFVFASKYEGFGFTVLEAMASGTPVISSNSSSLPEVCGNAAALFVPDDTVSLAKKLEDLLTHEVARAKMTKSGIVQAKQFSWEKSGEKLHRLLTSGVG